MGIKERYWIISPSGRIIVEDERFKHNAKRLAEQKTECKWFFMWLSGYRCRQKDYYFPFL